jgi:hypothetical protein
VLTQLLLPQLAFPETLPKPSLVLLLLLAWA